MSQIKAIQFNGQDLPDGADWDMGGTWVTLPDKTRKYIMPGDWLIGENGQYSEVLNNSEFNEKYSVQIIITHKTNNYMTENTGPVAQDMAKQTQSTPSFGHQLVGAHFNPSNDNAVDVVKGLFAQIANIVEDHQRRPSEKTRLEGILYQHTVGEILNAQMNVVKLITLKY